MSVCSLDRVVPGIPKCRDDGGRVETLEVAVVYERGSSEADYDGRNVLRELLLDDDVISLTPSLIDGRKRIVHRSRRYLTIPEHCVLSVRRKVLVRVNRAVVGIGRGIPRKAGHVVVPSLQNSAGGVVEDLARRIVLDVGLHADVAPLPLQVRLECFPVLGVGLRAKGDLQSLTVLDANAVRPNLPTIRIESRAGFLQVVRVMGDVVRKSPREHRALIRLGGS